MIATMVVPMLVKGFLLIGVVTEVVEPSVAYSWDKAKQGYAYVDSKINPETD